MTLGFEGVLVCGVADEDLGEQVVTLAGGIEEMDERSAYCHVCISSPLNSNSQRQNLGAGEIYELRIDNGCKMRSWGDTHVHLAIEYHQTLAAVIWLCSKLPARSL